MFKVFIMWTEGEPLEAEYTSREAAQEAVDWIEEHLDAIEANFEREVILTGYRRV